MARQPQKKDAELPRSVWKEIATFARKLARDHRALIASDPNYRKRARQVLTALYSHPSRGAGEDREAGCTAMLNSTAMEADRDNSARSKIPPVEGEDHIVREPRFANNGFRSRCRFCIRLLSPAEPRCNKTRSRYCYCPFCVRNQYTRN
jgi:hypothetical protein